MSEAGIGGTSFQMIRTSLMLGIDEAQYHQLKHSHHHAECDKSTREDPARLFVRLEICEPTEKVG